MPASPSSPKHYDKFTYAVKRKPENEADAPVGRSLKASNGKAGNAIAPGLQPLVLNRDGFAISEDGSLVSRLVSPPRFTPNVGTTAVGITSHAATTLQTNAMSASAIGATMGRSPARGTPQRGTPVKSPSATPHLAAGDAWEKLVDACGEDMTEEELALLSWQTVVGLLEHYGFTSPIDVAKCQLQWRERNTTFGGVVDESVPEHHGGDESVLLYTAPASKPLQQAPIQQIAYGRPSSPRAQSKGKYVPDSKKPLNWASKSRVDSGLR
jgi:hypothetical protein